MATLFEHERTCQEILGQPHTEIHLFLDQFNQPEERPFTSLEHRKYLHHLPGIIWVAILFGKEAICPAAVHILEDCLGYLPLATDYQDGTVDQYGRPKDDSKLNFRWRELFQS